MNRAGLSTIMLVAALATACAGGDSASTSPTSPSSPTPPASAPPTPPPVNSCAPSVPTNLTVSLTASTTRVFNWNESANAVDYFIQIGTASGSSDLIYTNTSKTTYTWAGASQGTYYARVHARNSCGSSSPSNEIVFQ